MSLNGYDESNNQGDINNAIVPSDFVIIKATEGVGYVDPDCDANYQQSKSAGKLLAHYHFARFDGNAPVDEANWFVNNTQGYFGESVPMLDLEVNPMTPDRAKAFLDRVYELTKVRGWIYGSQAMFNNGDWSALWHDYAALVACYGVNNPQNGYGDPNAPVTINGNWTIVGVQYTSKGRLPGYGGDLDLDLMYIDRAGWMKYAQGDRNAPAPTPAPVAAPVVQDPTPAPQPPVTETPAPVVVQPPVTSTPEVTPVAPDVTSPAPVVATPAPTVKKIPVTTYTAVKHPNFLEDILNFILRLLRIKK